MPASQTSPRRLTARERERQALSMRLQGKSFEQIAHSLGLHDRGAAYKAVRRVLSRLAAEAQADAIALRALELERLDAMLAGLWPAVESGDTRAVHVAIEVCERRSKLLGLDAPAKQEIAGAGAGAIRVIVEYQDRPPDAEAAA